MKYYNSDIVFQEIPDETTLAINICGCPNRCEGCHSKWLWKDEGMPLYEEGAEEDARFQGMDAVVGKYARNISCVCFMGGDQSPETVEKMAVRVRSLWPGIKTGWYSGRPAPKDVVKEDDEEGGLPKDESPTKTLFDSVQAAVPEIDIRNFDFIKLGPYIAELGGLRSPATNQRIYRICGDTAEIIHVLDPHKQKLA